MSERDVGAIKRIAAAIHNRRTSECDLCGSMAADQSDLIGLDHYECPDCGREWRERTYE